METTPTPPPGDAPLSDELRNAVENYQKAFRNFLVSRGVTEDAPESAEAKGTKLVVEITPENPDPTTIGTVQLPVYLEELLAAVYGSTPIETAKLELLANEATIVVRPTILYRVPDGNPYIVRDDVLFKPASQEMGYATEIRFHFDKGIYETGRAYNRYDPITREDKMIWTPHTLERIQVYAWKDIASYADHIPNTSANIVNKRIAPAPSRQMPTSFYLNSVNTPPALRKKFSP